MGTPAQDFSAAVAKVSVGMASVSGAPGFLMRLQVRCQTGRHIDSDRPGAGAAGLCPTVPGRVQWEGVVPAIPGCGEHSMLSFLGRSVRLCDGITRREALRVGGLGFTGLMYSDWLRGRAAAAQARPGRRVARESFGKAKACILI